MKSESIKKKHFGVVLLPDRRKTVERLFFFPKKTFDSRAAGRQRTGDGRYTSSWSALWTPSTQRTDINKQGAKKKPCSKGEKQQRHPRRGVAIGRARRHQEMARVDGSPRSPRTNTILNSHDGHKHGRMLRSDRDPGHETSVPHWSSMNRNTARQSLEKSPSYSFRTSVSSDCLNKLQR